MEAHVEPRLLIIPTEDVDEQDIVESLTTEGEGIMSLKSSRCIGHGVPSAISKSSNGKGSKKVRFTNILAVSESFRARNRKRL